VLSAVSGLGGLDLGLECAGFKHLGLIEIDPTARRSLKANRDGAWPLLEAHDILEVAEELRPAQLGIQPGEQPRGFAFARDEIPGIVCGGSVGFAGLVRIEVSGFVEESADSLS
jgi:site-specific DNA-cytosine methylase